MEKEPDPGELESEHRFLPNDSWSAAPPLVKSIANHGHNEGVPTAIGLYEGKWYVLQTSGQGPYLIYAEWWDADKRSEAVSPGAGV